MTAPLEPVESAKVEQLRYHGSRSPIVSVAEPEDLDAFAQRVLTAGDWPSLLARS